MLVRGESRRDVAESDAIYSKSRHDVADCDANYSESRRDERAAGSDATFVCSGAFGAVTRRRRGGLRRRRGAGVCAEPRAVRVLG